MDSWLATHALQNQEKHLSVTRVLLDGDGKIVGYYTLATGQIDFADLPVELSKHLPRRNVPVAVLAWLGVSSLWQGKGLRGRLLAQALHDCYEAGKTFPFIAVILDASTEKARSFYEHWDFKQLPGHPYRLFLSTKRLSAMMSVPSTL